jgi:hypothetical protein
MATFGQGINPQLGAIDYSPILKGSVAGAEMAAKGGQMIGQGLANLGQEVGKGIATYQLNKKIASDAIGDTEGLMQGSPAVVAWLTNPDNNTQAAKLARKLQKDGTLSVNDATSLHGAVLSFVKTDQQNKNTIIAQQQADADTLRSRAAMITAEREKAGTPGVEMTPAEVAAIPAGTDFKGIPLVNGKVFVTGLSRFAPSAVTNIDASTAAKNENIAYTDLIKRKSTIINPILDAQPTLMALKDILAKTGKDGMLTGAFANLELTTKSALNATGLTDFKDVAQTQAYLGASGRLVAQAVSAFGAGTGISDADRKYAQGIVGGNITLDKAALKRLVDLYEKGTASQIRNYNADVHSAFGDKPNDFSYRSLYLTPERISGNLSANALLMLQ